MARIGVGDKYNLAINGKGYLVRGLNYKKKDARAFSPRFGTGEMGETDLDTWKVLTQNDFSGGSFQEALEDITKVSLLDGLIRSNYDKYLYRAPVVVACQAGSSMKSSEFGTISFRGETYVIQNNSATGALYKLVGGSWTAVKTDFTSKLKALAVFKNKLYVCTGSGIQSFNGTTWAAGPSGTAFINIITFNGMLYGIGDPGDGSNACLYKFDGTTSTLVGDVGDRQKGVNSLCVYNHRLYLGKVDGLYTYDGVLISTVLDYSMAEDSGNFKSMCVYNGALYTTIANILYRFNGSSLEEIMDFTTFEDIKHLYSYKNKLWLMTADRQISQWVGKDGGTLVSGTVNIYRFDGQGWSKIHSAALSASGVGMGGEGSNLVIFTYVDGITANAHYYYPIGSEFNTAWNAGSVRQGDIVSSVFDAGFSNIDKTLESIEVDTNAMALGDHIDLSYRIYNGFNWGAWASLGTITSATSNRVNVHDAIPAGVVFKKIQVKISVLAGSMTGLSVRGYSLKYIIDPVYKREWQVSLLAVGTTDNPLELLDGSLETVKASALRENIYTSRVNPLPVSFEDIDFTIADGALAADNAGIHELDQSQLLIDGGGVANNVWGGGNTMAQGITPSKTGTLDILSLLAYHHPNGGACSVEFRTDNGNKPSNTVIGTGATFYPSGHTAYWIDIPVSVPVTAGVKIWAVISTGGPSWNYIVVASSALSSYAGGGYSENQLGTWVTSSTVDMAFKTYVSDGRADNYNVVKVDTTDLFPASGFIKIDDEIIEYASKDATHFLGCTRGSLGSTKATHADNSIVNLYFRVIVSDILNEEVYWPVDAPIPSAPVLLNAETILTVVLKEA